MESIRADVVLGKVTRRLIPFMFLMYVFNFIDRTNVSIAALSMKPDLGFSDAVYGLGAGIFFLGYLLFEVPSNLILERVGARLWMARIAFTWGLISAGMLFVRTPAAFYTMRFLLGVAEAGFFPGMILYLSYWFPAAERARAIARFMMAVPLSAVVAGPMSAALLRLDGAAGLKGWQWVFLGEGIPSVLIGVLALFFLTDQPSRARWLSADERAWLVERLQAERAHPEKGAQSSLLRAIAHPRLFTLSACYLALILCGYGLSFWAPLILQSRSGWSAATISAVGTLPNILASLGMVAIAARSDRTGDHRRYAATAAVVASLGFLLGAWTETPLPTLVAFTLVVLGVMGMMGPFWALCTDATRESAAIGIAMISAIGSLGGFLGPILMAALKGATQGYSVGLFTLASGMLVAAFLVLAVRLPARAPVLAAAAPSRAQ